MKNTYTKLTLIVLVAVGFNLSGCKKEAQVAPNNTNTAESDLTVLNSTSFLAGKLDGEEIRISGASSSYANMLTIDSDGGTHDYDHDADDNSNTGFITGIKWVSNNPEGIVATQGSIELRKLSVRVYVAPIVSDLPTYFYNIVTPSEYPFASSSNPNNGAFISLVDKNNVLWTSKGDQDGSTFQIISRGTNRGTATVISGIISSKMYDGHGHVKTFTSGAFNVVVGLKI